MKGYYKWCKRLLNNWKQKNVEHIVNLFDENVEYYETPAEKINTINEIEGIENVEPMTHTLDDFIYELREDVAEESVPIDDLLSNCDMHNGREVEVPKVVE